MNGPDSTNPPDPDKPPYAGDAGGAEVFRAELTRRAADAGFPAVGIAPADLAEAHHADRLAVWLAAGLHGEMEYLARAGIDRARAETVLPGARAVIVFAAPYHPGPELAADPAAGGPTVKIAKYALGEDYHDTLRRRLGPVVDWLDASHPGHAWRICVDSAPLLERAFAEAAGVGFFGKNTLLIVPKLGSFFLLAEIVTTAPLPPDTPVTGTCGTCTRCLDACPTGAFPMPGILDARKCLSYLTIEKKSPLDDSERAAVADAGWAFGCDICQDVCPYNKRPPAGLPEFAEGATVRRAEPAATFLDPASNGQFERRFADSPILRPGRRRVRAAVEVIAEKLTATQGRGEEAKASSGPPEG